MQLLRRIVQVAAAILVNSAFFLGQTSPSGLYQGGLKQLCSPGLNCYSCPYSVAACPLGSIQHFIAYGTYHFSLYVGGFLILAGVFFGRFICGWICPFGLLQDLIFKIKSPKFTLPPVSRHFRWAALVVLVLLLPLLTKDQAYCRYLCPAGTLEGGVPFGIFSSRIRAAIGGIFYFKFILMAFFLIGSIRFFRFFCRTACPLGLIYGWFNRISLLGLKFDPECCNDCGICGDVCPVDLKPEKGEFLSSACIRCLKCQKACPRQCFRFGLTSVRGHPGSPDFS